jgi:hypothetical protein
MNETFDIDESDSDESETKLVQVKLRQSASKRPVAIAAQNHHLNHQPLFGDIDENKKRESILLFETNFNLMQQSVNIEHQQGDINYGCIGVGGGGMEFLENELIPEGILDDVYNFSETNSTLNGSANLNNTQGRKSLGSKMDALMCTEEIVNNHKNTNNAVSNESENIDWLSSQIRALETSLDIPIDKPDLEHKPLTVEIKNQVNNDTENEDHEMLFSPSKNKNNRTQTNGELYSQLNKLSENIEYLESIEQSSTSTNSSKTIQFDENEVKCFLNEIVEKVCQLNETFYLLSVSNLTQNDKNNRSTSKVSQQQQQQQEQHIHEINLESRSRNEDDENMIVEFSNVKIEDVILMGKY